MRRVKKDFISNYIIIGIMFLAFTILCFLSDKDYKIFYILIIYLLIALINYLVLITRINRYKKSNITSFMEELEKDLESSKLVYNGWYIMDNYMFSIKKFIAIYYKDIEVIEGRTCLVGRRHMHLGWRETIYLKNGEKYVLKSSRGESEEFDKIVKKNNPDIYFGLIEEYKRLQEIRKK